MQTAKSVKYARIAVVLYAAAALIYYIIEAVDGVRIISPPFYYAFEAAVTVFPMIALLFHRKKLFAVSAFAVALWDIYCLYLMSFDLNNVLFFSYLADIAILVVSLLSIKNRSIPSGIWFIPAALKTVQILFDLSNGYFGKLVLRIPEAGMLWAVRDISVCVLGIFAALFVCLWLKENVSGGSRKAEDR